MYVLKKFRLCSDSGAYDVVGAVKDGDDARSRRRNAVRPNAHRIVHLSPFSRMLNGAEKRQVVGRELRAADFARERAAQKLAQPAAVWAFDRNGVDAVILGERARRAVGRDP